MRSYLISTTVAFVVGMAALPVQASTLVADGVTYSLTGLVLNSTTDQFTLAISGINGTSDTEKGRYGVQSFAFSTPANFLSAAGPAGFAEQAGGLNASGCDGNGAFFCFAANTTPTAPALAANSVIDLVFDVTLSSGSFAGYDPSFKINWDGTKNNYDLVSEALAPTFSSTTPLPATLPLFAGGLGFIGYLTGRKKRKVSQALTFA
jgi:hypothetical protein